MIDKAPIGNNPVAVVIVALVGWIAIRLALGLLRQAGLNIDKVSMSPGGSRAVTARTTTAWATILAMGEATAGMPVATDTDPEGVGQILDYPSDYRFFLYKSNGLESRRYEIGKRIDRRC